MSDPRYTDPRYSNQLSDPVGRRNDAVGSTWGWIAGIVVIALIAFFLIAGGKGVNNNTASNSATSPTATSPMASRPAPRTTTGMGGPSHFPAATPPATTPPAPKQ